MKMILIPISLKELNHEIRTSLTTILGITTLLDKEKLISNQRLYIQDLKKCIQGILNLVDKLSLLSQEISFYQMAQNEIASASLNYSSVRVLLVEDSELLQVIHKKMLENLGCQVELTSSAEKALYKLSMNTYDLILLDIGLPGMSGIDAAVEIRRQEQNKNLPIIALTAYYDKETHEACLNAGIDDVATKPISQEKLQKLINCYCGRKIMTSI